ncbi:MAG: SDR family oxidoreductase [Planctomycetes bacterium]|nr:SDR family oxidoreductase [Planctomycetota bacterium]
MKANGNTILVTGGGSGIGRALAESLHASGNRVVIAGRRLALLQEVVRANPGMDAVELDVENGASIGSFSLGLCARHPQLNVVVHNAGIMRAEDLRSGSTHLPDAEATIATNLLGPIRLTAALLPHLLSQRTATVVTVTSGLAFVPLATFPTYCATKAALHSWTESLRYQLQGTSVEVVELPPPYVQTELTGAHQASDPRAMPLAEFVAESMRLLSASPTPAEVLVDRVKPLRFAGKGDYHGFFQAFNDSMAGTRH